MFFFPEDSLSQDIHRFIEYKIIIFRRILNSQRVFLMSWKHRPKLLQKTDGMMLL